MLLAPVGGGGGMVVVPAPPRAADPGAVVALEMGVEEGAMDPLAAGVRAITVWAWSSYCGGRV